jgi:hypothetical protein
MRELENFTVWLMSRNEIERHIKAVKKEAKWFTASEMAVDLWKHHARTWLVVSHPSKQPQGRIRSIPSKYLLNISKSFPS